jgi:probable HAF family extracellular repeat protein
MGKISVRAALILATACIICSPAKSNTFGFIYSGGTYTTVSDPASPNNSLLQGINNFGQSVGTSFTANPQGFEYANGAFNPINFPTAFDTRANGINDFGQIVGVANGSQAFLYSGGSYTALNIPYSAAYGINDRGQVVGYYFQPTTSGFIYSAGSLTSLNVPSASATFATGINNLGQVVGWYSSAGDHGFLYSNGTYTYLNDPLSTTNVTVATGINDLGQIVGYYYGNATGNYYDGNNQYHGFLYSNGKYTTLDDPLSNGNTFAWGINDLGQIAGRFDENVAVTPLPPAWTMMLIGLAGFGFVAYRRKSKPALMAA